ALKITETTSNSKKEYNQETLSIINAPKSKIVLVGTAEKPVENTSEQQEEKEESETIEKTITTTETVTSENFDMSGIPESSEITDNIDSDTGNEIVDTLLDQV